MIYPPTQKATVFETVDECVEGTLRSSYERSGVCFGGFRPTKHVEEPRLRAVTHFGVQALNLAWYRAGMGFSPWELHLSQKSVDIFRKMLKRRDV